MLAQVVRDSDLPSPGDDTSRRHSPQCHGPISDAVGSCHYSRPLPLTLFPLHAHHTGRLVHSHSLSRIRSSAVVPSTTSMDQRRGGSMCGPQARGFRRVRLLQHQGCEDQRILARVGRYAMNARS